MDQAGASCRFVSKAAKQCIFVFLFTVAYVATPCAAADPASNYIAARKALKSGSVDGDIEILEFLRHPENKHKKYHINFTWLDDCYKIRVSQSDSMPAGVVLLTKSDLVMCYDGQRTEYYNRPRKGLVPDSYPPCLTNPRLLGIVALPLESIGLDNYNSLIGRTDVSDRKISELSNGRVLIDEELPNRSHIKSIYSGVQLIDLSISGIDKKGATHVNGLVMSYDGASKWPCYPASVTYTTTINGVVQYQERIILNVANYDSILADEMSIASLGIPDNSTILNRSTGERKFVVSGQIADAISRKEETAHILSSDNRKYYVLSAWIAVAAFLLALLFSSRTRRLFTLRRRAQ